MKRLISALLMLTVLLGNCFISMGEGGEDDYFIFKPRIINGMGAAAEDWIISEEMGACFAVLLTLEYLDEFHDKDAGVAAVEFSILSSGKCYLYRDENILGVLLNGANDKTHIIVYDTVVGEAGVEVFDKASDYSLKQILIQSYDEYFEFDSDEMLEALNIISLLMADN